MQINKPAEIKAGNIVYAENKCLSDIVKVQITDVFEKCAIGRIIGIVHSDRTESINYTHDDYPMLYGEMWTTPEEISEKNKSE